MYNNRISPPPTHDFVANPCIPTHDTNYSKEREVCRIEPLSQTEAEMNKLDSQVSIIIDQVAMLQNKLKPVMVETDNLKPKDGPRPMLVPIADALYTLNERIAYANDMLNSILNRIEI